MWNIRSEREPTDETVCVQCLEHSVANTTHQVKQLIYYYEGPLTVLAIMNIKI